MDSKDSIISSIQRELQSRVEEAEFDRKIGVILTEILSWLNPDLIDIGSPAWSLVMKEIEPGLRLILMDIFAELPRNISYFAN